MIVHKRCLVLSLLLQACCVRAKSMLRNGDGGEQDRNLQDGVVCNVIALDGQFEDGTGKELYQCFIDRDNDGFEEYSYMIDLPDDFVDANRECIESGNCYLNIPGGRAVEDEESYPMITVPSAATISADDRSEPHGRQLAITGERKTLVIRVTTADRSCDPSAVDLAGSVFGLGRAALENNMAKQYWDCSNQQLQFTPFDVGNNIVDGVVEITLPEKAWGTDIFSLQNKMYQATVDTVGNSLIAARHLMYCVPFGMKFDGSIDWVAFANMNGKSSYYNNKWCDRLSSQVHEVGHNLGMEHSNENGGEYGDESGMMGFSHSERNGPLMCFNAFKNYKFGWYADQTAFVNPSSNGAWTGELAAFVDANEASPSQVVIIRLGDTYIQLNSAKKFNSGTKEKRNRVVLVQGTYDHVVSHVVDGLAAGDAVSVEGAIVHVCDINFGGSSSVDYATVSIYTSSQSTGCPQEPDNLGDDPWYCFIPIFC